MQSKVPSLEFGMFRQNTMGNGIVKAPKAEDSCTSSSVRDSASGALKKLQETVLLLEEELRRKWEELKEKDERIKQLEKELQAKVSQIEKLQDAIGYNSNPTSPLTSQENKLNSVINQVPNRCGEHTPEVQRRLKAKEGVSAEPTSRKFYCPSTQNFTFELASFRKESR
ncbi:hypothetical protein NDU88_009706 [Pleurodeles waltl]|uniref:Uncharacterized protein n=1 Tax=Pleurodeles waltl TaxID=8319 RepID=A0AAV7QSB9_PLEWA|nr:hypothetical protein NDU88_009706 [Pleurodeles waltl]